MKINKILFGAAITASAFAMTAANAGSTTNTALTSALGGVVGAAGGRAPRERRQAHRRHHPVLRRALPVHHAIPAPGSLI